MTEDYWISLDYATFCITLEEEVIVESAPIAKWMVGKTLKEIKEWVKFKRGKMVRMLQRKYFYYHPESDALYWTYQRASKEEFNQGIEELTYEEALKIAKKLDIERIKRF